MYHEQRTSIWQRRQDRPVLLLGSAAGLVALIIALTGCGGGSDSDGGEVGRLGEDQELAIFVLGQPAYFESDMSVDEGETPPRIVTHDIWFYPDAGVRFIFIDGSYVGSDDIEPLPDEADLPSVTPGQFREGMSLAQVQEVIGEEPFEQATILPSVIEDARLYQFLGVYAGFESDRLVYISTLPYVLTATSQWPVPAGEPLVALFPWIGPASDNSTYPSSPSFQVRAVAGKVLKWISRIGQVKQASEEFQGELSAEEIEEQVKLGSQYLKQQAEQLRVEAREKRRANDLIDATKLERVADKADGMAEDLIDELLPKLKGKFWEEFRGDSPRKTITFFSPLPLPWNKPESSLEGVVSDYLQDRNGRGGALRPVLQDWIGNESGRFFTELSEDQQQSFILDVLETEIRKRCKKGDEECFWATFNDLKGNVVKKFPGGPAACFEALEELREDRNFQRPVNLVMASWELPRLPGGMPAAHSSAAASCPLRGAAATAQPTAPPDSTLQPTGAPPSISVAPTPVGQTPSPTPTPTPVGQTPSPTPTATPVGQTPSPTPTPTPVGLTPSPTPTPTPVGQTPSPTPTEVSEVHGSFDESSVESALTPIGFEANEIALRIPNDGEAVTGDFLLVVRFDAGDDDGPCIVDQVAEGTFVGSTLVNAALSGTAVIDSSVEVVGGCAGGVGPPWTFETTWSGTFNGTTVTNGVVVDIGDFTASIQP